MNIINYIEIIRFIGLAFIILSGLCLGVIGLLSKKRGLFSNLKPLEIKLSIISAILFILGIVLIFQ
jgi:hypothetical protein